ncbi:hypothetical protein BJY01DRAFT_221279 [Aspergillus pseudoustus]|uniref:Autophagy-related protein n=1 Tax=Aspergillus pseudoustus TaxID=1810923 RepID=A0ABR4JBF7_9EURO
MPRCPALCPRRPPYVGYLLGRRQIPPPRADPNPQQPDSPHRPTNHGFANNPATRYVGVFRTTAGANANIPASMAYQANNIRGQWTRAFASASLVGLGGVGGIAGSLVFRSQDAPQYIPGIWAAIASQLLLITIVCLLSVYFWASNRQADRGEKVIEGSAGFRYTL